MEDLLPLLVFAVILIVNVAKAALKVSKKAQPGEAEMPGETDADTAFDTEWDTAQETEWDSAAETVVEAEGSTVHETATYASTTEASTCDRPASRTQEPKDRRIRLNTPEDARRAFIYSEIFQRKYNT